MFKLKHLCRLAALLMLTACATSKQQSPQPTKPLPLDSALAAPCAVLEAPDTLDYDVWQSWLQDVVLRAYGDCAARHAKAVAAWPK